MTYLRYEAELERLGALLYGACLLRSELVTGAGRERGTKVALNPAARGCSIECAQVVAPSRRTLVLPQNLGARR